MAISVKQLHPLFVSEVGNVDLRRPLEPDTIAEIVAAMDRYAVCVFRDQPISDEQQIAFSRNFGELEHSPNYGRTKGQEARLKHQELFDVSNLNEKNEIYDRDDDRRMFRLGNQLWHTDSSFLNPRGRYSLLHARKIPPDGADTQFADERAAYDALPAALKSRVEGLVAEHFFAHIRLQLGFGGYSEAQLQARPAVRHAVVQIHAGSGRKHLYLAAHASHIVDMPIPEGRVMLTQLIEFATQREFVYSHKWHIGDLVMWDNRCTMHRATPFDEERHVRDLRRTTVSDGAVAFREAAA
jgi:alpha-ketoglutarate-dependent 2,4-dichlorophenoxyacetate dioxygenase